VLQDSTLLVDTQVEVVKVTNVVILLKMDIPEKLEAQVQHQHTLIQMVEMLLNTLKQEIAIYL
jgi:hypothetical protein